MSVLYRKVSKQILEDISTGVRKVGDQLPPEVEFASELGVSRSTVRLAFNQLESIGVLRRRKRLGTQIIADQAQSEIKIDSTVVKEQLERARNHQLCVERLSTVRTEEIAELEKVKHKNESSVWLEVLGNSISQGETEPSAINRIYVPERFSAIEQQLMDTGASVLTTIENVYGVKVGRLTQFITPVTCSESAAKVFNIEAGSPIIQIDIELYETGGELMEIVFAHVHVNANDSMRMGDVTINGNG